MACTLCTTPKSSPCVECGELEICECENKIDQGCVQFSGDTLSCIGVIAGDLGDDVLVKIDAAICTLQTDLAECCLSGLLDCDLLVP